MIPDLPWNVHPDLTRDRLTAVGHLIAKGRNDAVTWQNEDIGDDSWILGCRAFQSSRHQIVAAAGTEQYPWLGIVDGSRALIFKIGSVPVRFYRGPADEPTDRTLRQTFSELEQLSLVFHDERKELAYRLAVETDIDGAVSSIKFVGLLGEQPVLSWRIPLERQTAAVIAVSPPAEGVELPAPSVEFPGTDEEDSSKAG